MITRADIVREARALLRVPFRHQGLEPATGLDCRGVILCVAKALDVPLLQDYRNDYQRRPDSAEVRAALEAELDPVAIEDAREGAVLFIRLPRESGPTHLGILSSGPYEPMIIHALARDRFGGRIVEEPLRRWLPHVSGAFHFRGVTD